MKYLIQVIVAVTFCSLMGLGQQQTVDGVQIKPMPRVRNPKRELSQGQAILRPRFDKDEAAFKLVILPTPDLVRAEHDLQLCFAVARSTEGMYNIPAGKGMQPNCDRQFAALEKLLP